MNFRVTGLAPDGFAQLYALSDEELKRRGVVRYVVDEVPGFPDRIEMREGKIGETMLLINHASQPAATPYRATHAIFVREGATARYDAVNQIPEVMRTRLLSLRAFDEAGMMLDADVAQGIDVEPLIARLLSDPSVAHIHAHNAKRGCYSGRIERA